VLAVKRTNIKYKGNQIMVGAVAGGLDPHM